MPPLEAFGPTIVVGLLLFVMLWFALGTQRNIRRGNDLLRWLQGALPMLGRRTTLRWLGSSAVELGIVEPEAPFREATVLAVLEPRDVAALWAYARWRGRRDFVIVRANLRRAPRFSADIRDPRGWTGRADYVELEEGDETQLWPDGIVAHVTRGADGAAIRAAWRSLSNTTAGVWRLTVQPVVPHVEVHFRPPPAATDPARVLTPIRDLAEELAGA